MSLLFIEKVDAAERTAFEKKVLQIAGLIHPKNPFAFANWMMAVMSSESGMNAQAVNKQKASVPGYDSSGQLVKPAGAEDSSNAFVRAKYRATGLIQFMPRTAAYLGTTTRDLYQMTGLQQLDYVYKYLAQWKGRYNTFVDLYLAVFYPKYLGLPPETEFPKSITPYNTGIDLDKSGIITIKEFALFALKKIPLRQLETSRPDIFRAFFFITEQIRQRPLLTAFLFLSASALLFIGIKNYRNG